MEDAFREYINNEDKKKNGEPTAYKETMQCFCRSKGKEKKDQVYKISLTKDYEEKFCEKFFKDKTVSFILGTAISFIIIAVNTILKILIIKLIETIRYDTQSEKIAAITNGVFIAQFFNTGILLLLVNANISEHFLGKFISSGKYYDYYPEWYQDVGTKIVKTMIINCIMPYITLGTSVMIPKMMRLLDGGNPYKTKKTSMAKFKMLHGGKDYVIHFKYSNLLNITYITMMYGMGMPILFPVAIVNYLNQYFCERYIVAYCMKLPPALDDKLTRNFVKMLKWAPLLLLANGYWMISNH